MGVLDCRCPDYCSFCNKDNSGRAHADGQRGSALFLHTED